jgi:pimeloyl-ACP methyl ester carboxylesterase
MNPIDTLRHRTAPPSPGLPRTGVRLGLALLTSGLLATTACGIDSRSEFDSTSTATAPSADETVTTSVVPASTTVPLTARPTATIDELVDTGGARVHVRCVGHGDTTVLLIPGFGGNTTSWTSIEPAIANHARVCSYDRPGTGTSEPATSKSTFSTQAHELRTLLDTIGESGPYVAVGHSFGGAEAITFASLFADEVTGLVLVDASPTSWPAALCAVVEDGSEGAAMLRNFCTDTFAPTGNSEQLDVVTAFAEAAEIVSLGSLPMAVITATHRELPADLAASEVARLDDAWNQGQQTWMALSSNARLVPVDDSGHNVQIDQPGVVIDEITRLLP